jgi:membrane associated rhomboid family serine protease
MATTIETALKRFASATMLMKIVVINIAVFLVLNIISIVMIFAGEESGRFIVEQWVAMPGNFGRLARHAWTPLSYMFSQIEPLHLIFNMLWLYWFGIVFQLLSTPKRMIGLYLLGGLGGAALYLLAVNTIPYFAGHGGLLIGSSASVIAIVTATAIMAPDYRMNLLFLGAVSLKWIAIVTIGIDLLSVTGSNAGGHIAHLGGAAVGAIFALGLKRGHDITAPLNSLIDAIVNLFRRRPKVRPARFRASGAPSAPRPKAPSAASAADQAELDNILDKIKKSGYSSLTADERARLFDVSRRIK